MQTLEIKTNTNFSVENGGEVTIPFCKQMTVDKSKFVGVTVVQLGTEYSVYLLMTNYSISFNRESYDSAERRKAKVLDAFEDDDIEVLNLNY